MPGSIRLFVAAPLLANEPVSATPGQARYLGAVMRRVVGDPVVLFNGAEGEWQARITHLHKDRATLLPETMLRPQGREPDIWLLFAPLKRDATDLVTQKATELGVSVLQPVLTDRTNTERVNLERMASIATEAAEQCERLTVPVIRHPRRLADVLVDWPADRGLVAAIERGAYAAIGAWGPGAGAGTDMGSPPAAGALLIGPEGGFSDRELDLLVQHPFVHPVSLGPLILRADTAAIAGLALLQARLQERFRQD